MTPPFRPLPVPEKVKALASQRQEILALAPEKALDRILEAPQPTALVHSFAVQDLYLLIHDIGPEDALPLLAMASHRQLETILDLALWHKDRVHLTAALRWIDLLLKADRSRFTGWLMDEKRELLELLLFYGIDLAVRDHDQDPGELGEGLTTFDNVYYFRIRDMPPGDPLTGKPGDAGHRQAVLHSLLENLSLRDHTAFQQLLLRSRYVVAPEAEEDAFHWRNARLAEAGLPPFDEAVGVYQPLTTAQMTARGPKPADWRRSPDSVAPPVPVVPAQMLDGDNLLVRALSRIASQAELADLQGEFAGLCNQIIVADVTETVSRESLQPAVHKAAGYLSIGLETACDPELPVVDQAAELLRRFPMTHLFKVGYGTALRLKWRADRWKQTCWSLRQGFALTFWDAPWFGLLGGLLLKRPLFYDPSRPGRPYREFARLSEVTDTEAACEQVAALDGVLARMRWQRPASGQLPSQMTYKRFLLTLWARSALQLGERLAPIPLSRFRPFYAALWETGVSGRRLTATAKASFRDWMAECAGLAPAQLDRRVGSVIDALLSDVEAALGNVRTADLDPRYVSHFILAAKAPAAHGGNPV
jgi:hypothetical protein